MKKEGKKCCCLRVYKQISLLLFQGNQLLCGALLQGTKMFLTVRIHFVQTFAGNVYEKNDNKRLE